MSEQRFKYRGYHVSYDPKPIPDRRFDWDFWHEDFDGGLDEPGGTCTDHRHGNAESADAAREKIDEIISEDMIGAIDEVLKSWGQIKEELAGPSLVVAGREPVFNPIVRGKLEPLGRAMERLEFALVEGARE